jgi:hypothetical protein
MRFSLILGFVPFATALQLAYSPPAALLAKAEAEEDCNLPRSYIIKNFSGKSNNTGETLSSYNFTFTDSTTKTTTLCHFNSTSTSTTPPGLTPRYACENGGVKFIWEDDDKDLWMIERVCPGPDGYVSASTTTDSLTSLTDNLSSAADYEVSGSMHLTLACTASSGNCTTNSTMQESLFTSVNPIRDPTRLL